MVNMSIFHTPVLLNEAIDYLDIKKDAWYIDCNLGGGGHTKAILDKGGRILAFDVDPDAIAYVKQNLPTDRLIIVQENFNKLKEVTEKNNIKPKGILFDLGASSHHFDSSPRGFSFQRNEDLDMRMDPRLGVKASDLVNVLNATDLEKIFRDLGEEPFARKIAQAIVVHRKVKPIHSTQELVDVVLTVKRRLDKIHPATQVFQALRIAVNDELNNIKEVLPQAVEILGEGGRIVVISFHSLEDRIVKNFFKNNSSLQLLTKKPVCANDKEVESNPRSRSAKLRAAIKL